MRRRSLEFGGLDSESSWVCERCNKSNAMGRDVCWKCSKARTEDPERIHGRADLDWRTEPTPEETAAVDALRKKMCEASEVAQSTARGAGKGPASKKSGSGRTSLPAAFRPWVRLRPRQFARGTFG